MPKTPTSVPICIDLDGTLTYADTLIESYLQWLKSNPLAAILAWRFIFRGRAAFKRVVAKHAHINPSLLPYNEPLIAWLKEQKKIHNQQLIIATASDAAIGTRIAEHLGFIDDVIGSDGTQNLAGDGKREMLINRFGHKGFDYIGNAAVDLKVWPAARHIIIANASPSVRQAAKEIGPVFKEFDPRRDGFSIRIFIKELRVHQWVKNLLLFVPLITSHAFLDLSLLTQTIWAFVAFSLTASSVYLLNDLLDLESDRQHVTKRYRPLAAGTLSIKVALAALCIMPVISFTIAANLPSMFLWLLGAYVCINILYSLLFKGIPLLDVVVLTSLYVLRILAGSAASDIPTSIWLFIFAACIFLSLALVKRASELFNLEKQGKTKSVGRGYWVHHRKLLINVGIGSSALSLVVLAFYITSPAVTPLYGTPNVLWLLVPLFSVWLARTWRLTISGRMHEDPVVFAARDAISYITIFAAFIVLFLAI